MKKYFSILFLLSFLTVLCFDSFAVEYKIQLNNGEEIQDSFRLNSFGLISSSKSNRMYAWSFIDLKSLPLKLKKEIRNSALKDLLLAQRYYDDRKMKTAAKYFKAVLLRKQLLTSKDRQLAEYANIKQKSEGLIQYNYSWVTFENFMTLKGLIFYNKRWIEVKKYREINSFESALKKSTSGENREESALYLQFLLKKYPNTEYRLVTEKMINKLLGRYEK